MRDWRAYAGTPPRGERRPGECPVVSLAVALSWALPDAHGGLTYLGDAGCRATRTVATGPPCVPSLINRRGMRATAAAQPNDRHPSFVRMALVSDYDFANRVAKSTKCSRSINSR